jgi:CBS domain-containing protein
MPIGKLSGHVRKHLQRLRARSAKEFMTREVITVMDKMPAASALALSAEKRVKRLPVVNADGRHSNMNSIRLLQQRELLIAGLYFIGSCLTGDIAVVLGMALDSSL